MHHDTQSTHTHTHTLSEPSPRSLRLLRLERHHVDATAAIVRIDGQN